MLTSRIVADPERFPTGIKAADDVRAKGLEPRGPL
jgi:hypothetical protein